MPVPSWSAAAAAPSNCLPTTPRTTGPATVPGASTSDPPVPLASIQSILITAIPFLVPFASFLPLPILTLLYPVLSSFSSIRFSSRLATTSVVKALFLPRACSSPFFCDISPPLVRNTRQKRHLATVPTTFPASIKANGSSSATRPSLPTTIVERKKVHGLGQHRLHLEPC
ncbi:hypothetical protein PWT90_06678 [Aphanocladium album]|nr:hypothetical protein PWT90_06678 [Aphanocladium album]